MNQKWIRFTERYPGEDEWINEIEVALMLVECDIETLEPLYPLNPIILNGSVNLAFWSNDIVIDKTDIMKLDPMTHDYNGEELPNEVSAVYSHIIDSRTKEWQRNKSTYDRVFIDYAWMPWKDYLQFIFEECTQCTQE